MSGLYATDGSWSCSRCQSFGTIRPNEVPSCECDETEEGLREQLATVRKQADDLLALHDAVEKERDRLQRALNVQTNARALTVDRDDDQLTQIENYLLDEADFNRSWADGRRGSDRDFSEAYKARRIELAEQRERWAAHLRAVRADLDVMTAARNEACDWLGRCIDELAEHETDPNMMWGHRQVLERLRKVGAK